MKNNIGNKKQVEGFDVDFTKDEAISFLVKARWRIVGQLENNYKNIGIYRENLQVSYKRSWYTLARTDLKDDTCTSSVMVHDKENPVNRFINACRYGARLYVHADKRRTLAVIDSFSDG